MARQTHRQGRTGIEGPAGVVGPRAASPTPDPARETWVDPGRPDRIGPYAVERVLGRDGLSATYVVRRDGGGPLVLRLVHAGIADESARARFDAVASRLTALRHPGLAAVLEAGTADRGDGPQPYLVTELVRGPDLLTHAAALGLDARARLELLAEVCDAVETLHRAGLAHRALRPGNIRVVAESAARSGGGLWEGRRGGGGEPAPVGAPSRPRTKVLDAGVEHATDADVRTATLRTEVGRLARTAGYLAPEQAAGDVTRLDARTDVFALGVIAFELLAGRLPFALRTTGESDEARLAPARDVVRLGPVPPLGRAAVESVIARALDPDPQRRHRSAGELGRALREVARGTSGARRPARAWTLAAGRVALITAIVGVAAVVAITLAPGRRASDHAAALDETLLRQRRIAEARRDRAEDGRRRAERELEAARRDAAEAERALVAETGRRLTLEAARAEAEGERRLAFATGVAWGRGQALRAGGMGGAGAGEAPAGDLVRPNQALAIPEAAFAEERRDLERRVEAEQARADRAEARIVQFAEQIRLAEVEHGRRLTDAEAEVEAERERADLAEEALRRVRDESAGSLARERDALLADLASLLDAAQTPRDDPGALRPTLARLAARLDGAFQGDPSGEAEVRLALGRAFRRAGAPAAAEPHLARAVQAYRAADDAPEQRRLEATAELAGVCRDLGRREDAAALLAEAVELSRRVHGDEDARTLAMMDDLAKVDAQAGRADEAEALYVRTLEIRRRRLGSTNPETLDALARLAALLVSRARWAEAADLARELVAARRMEQRSAAAQNAALTEALELLGAALNGEEEGTEGRRD